MKLKQRLDKALAERYNTYSRNQIHSWIVQEKAFVDGTMVNKPGFQVTDNMLLELHVEEPPYVCRAGVKLEKALDAFTIDVHSLTVLDAGLSTGGFTDCLLQRGAHKVYGVDVGYGQVHEKIRNDPRVVLLEKTNLRYLTDIGEQVDLITLDLSFISLLKVMPAVAKLLKAQGQLITLIKPQFEAQRNEVGKGGIIKDPVIHQRVLQEVISGIEEYGFNHQNSIDSPITGAHGNKEFLAFFIKSKLPTA
jgi:23S rRNA (cytidine1920-2'-O)/16S rRNA (cytidine1409-2'-O)-methyltransferase